MTDAMWRANAVRLRGRFENGQALVEHLRRRCGGAGVEPAGTFRRIWPHELQISGHGIHALKALIASLPLLRFADDPDEAEAFAGLMPRRPDPAARNRLFAHFATGDDR